MLKSIVNGAEHDIVSIPMKGKNLFDGNGISTSVRNVSVNSIGQSLRFHGTASASGGRLQPLTSDIVMEAGTYRIKAFGQKSIQLFLQEKGDTTKYYRFDNTLPLISLEEQTTFFISCGVVEGTQYDETVSIMLNSGSTALPYEPYGYQNGWEVRDNQNRLIWGREDELGTTTGTLMFNGYDLPIKVNSLLGSAAQNGTPSPNSPIIPEFCGVRTKNICPSATAETKTNNGITAVSNGSGTYHVSGTATADADIRFNVKSFWIPQSIGNYHDGTFSMFNSAIYDNTAVKLAFYYQGTKLDDWGLTTLNRTSTTYAIMSEKDCDAIGFTVKSGVTVDFTISPEFTNDGVLPTEFEPYGYKISFDNNGENLWNYTIEQGGWLAAAGSIPTKVEPYESLYTNRCRVADIIPIPYSTMSLTCQDGIRINFVWINADGVSLGGTGWQQNGSTVTAPENSTSMTFILAKVDDSTCSPNNFQSIMLYFNETTPIYLGEVPTIRRIKKLVLTGNEPWIYESAYTRFYIEFQNSLIIGLRATPAFCTHFQVISDGRPLADVPNDSMYSNSNVDMKWFFKQTEYTTVDAWKSYIADQYANGTPVTIWYILANPQTGIVNEPLAKIGNYTDELTEISVHNLYAPLYGIGDYKDILNLSTGVVTRKIKKQVFNGSEPWVLSGNIIYMYNTNTEKLSSLICTHFPNVQNTGMWNGNNWVFQVDISNLGMTTHSAWITYLQQQYASGTPVTVWYILETPETETVTVPTGMTGEIEGYLTQISTPTPTHQSIPKWNGKEETGGTYAVTVYTPPEIPTTTGQNTLTVETEKIHGLTNPLCGIGDYKDVLNLSTGIITRKVKKMVLTGEETWTIVSGKLCILRPSNCRQYSPSMSTHFIQTQNASNTGEMYIGGSYINFNYDGVNDDIDTFKTFLQQQYQNGTPVTIWYALNTPETETITVPYGLDCTVEGYLTQSTAPTPSNPITPESNGILESGGTYAVEVSLVPSNLTVKGHIKPIQ